LPSRPPGCILAEQPRKVVMGVVRAVAGDRAVLGRLLPARAAPAEPRLSPTRPRFG
jgi:hypothetical protein